MKLLLAGVTIVVTGLLANASHAADGYMSSPAFIQQVSGTGFSSLSTSAIMKPLMDMSASMPSVANSPTSGNLANTLQVGEYNMASIEQSGSGNIGFIQQSGTYNTATITQSSIGNQAFVSQQGRNNVAIIHQH
ncbi:MULTISPECIES: hypothetical protein [unclassified Rhizobium]|uniref:hypothetical protein n=1 Tax=unclassified Rhizobium TaxID=2613769 RepID=UPI001ADA2935|nr:MULTISPECIES: hypothetical protein [unclassified Rhizobium]MBO9172250.1 hypothetical protein [Rhizobium sp. L245/93]QXZ80934.1 hypothetical protein J5274_18610 [Rhizobium sp. L51/94]